MQVMNLLILFFIITGSTVSCKDKHPPKETLTIKPNKLDIKIKKDIKFLKVIQSKYKDPSYSIMYDKELKIPSIVIERKNILYLNSESINNLLLLAIIFEKNELVKYLINNKIDINKKIHPIWNNIFSSIIISGNLNLIKYYINNKKAKLYYSHNNVIQYSILNSILNIADYKVSWYPKLLTHKYIEIIDYMYKKKHIKLKDFTLEDSKMNGLSIWYKSLKLGIIPLYKYLLSIGVNINYLNNNKQNSLIISILYGGVDRSRFIGYEKCKKEKGTKKSNFSYLRYGDIKNRFKLIKYLIKNKININQIDDKEKTALDYSLEILNEHQYNKNYENDVFILLKKYGAKRACEILDIKCKNLECKKYHD